MGRGILLGALLPVVMAFPVAAVLALVYRFPVPFAGYRSGVSAMGPAMLAVVFYGLFGGFPLLAASGGLAGAIVSKMSAGEGDLYWKRIMLPCLLVDLAAFFLLFALCELNL